MKTTASNHSIRLGCGGLWGTALSRLPCQTFHELPLPSGIYIYRIEAGEWQASGKMVLMK
jgi:hypothetical protein